MRYNRGNKPFKGNRNSNSDVKGIAVEVRNGDVTKAIRIFKKKVQEDGVIQEFKERQQYVKPSEKKRKAKAAGRKRWLKKQEKARLDRGW